MGPRSKKAVLAFCAITVCAALAGGLVGNRLVRAETSPDLYTELGIFSEVLSHVKKNYVEEVDNQALVEGAIRGMLNSLDPHSSYMSVDMFKEMQVDTRGEFGGLGIQIGIKDGGLTVIAPIEDTPAFEAGIEAGDKIVKIEGEPTKDITLQEAVQKLRGPKGTKVTITIFRAGWKEFKDVTITRDVIKIKSVKHRLLEEGIGYVKLNQFQERTAQDLEKALRALREENIHSLVLDLRNNPGGLLTVAVEVADSFLPPEKLVVYTQDRAGERSEYRTQGRQERWEGPMVVLVNPGSASASEIVSGALKDWDRAVVMGEQTFGKGSVQTVIPLSDGSGLRLTTAKYYTPDGISIQNTGITPDIVVTRSAKGESPHGFVRESDLKGHLDNEQTKNSMTDEEPKGDTPAEPGSDELVPDGGDRPVEINGTEEEQDAQLQRAVDLLKTWRIFQNLNVGSDS